MNTEITEDNFLREVLLSDTPVLLDFFASWCTPCMMLAEELEQIGGYYGGTVRICRVNVDIETGLAARYSINEVPTVILFVNGRSAARFTGFRSAEDIEAMILRHLEMRYRCAACGYVHDERNEAVRFEDLPDNWRCPRCGAPKQAFGPVAD